MLSGIQKILYIGIWQCIVSGMIHVSLQRGDVSAVQAEAIVNAANTSLVMGAGVAGAIRRRAGPKVQEECSAHMPIDLSEVAVTSAGNLRAKYILHAATMRPAGFSSVDIIARATENIISKCTELGLTHIAMPAIGCGIAGVDPKSGIRVILGTILAKKSEIAHPLKIDLVLFSETDLRTAREYARQIDLPIDLTSR